MRSIELFTGAGGLALGTHRAGFHHLAAVEFDHDACQTLRLNVARRSMTGIDWPIIEADVSIVDYARYGDDIDFLAGGPPCQPFSLGGKHAGQADHRNMFPQVFRAVRELRPRAFLLENVRGLARTSFRRYLDYIVAQLSLPFAQPLGDEGWQDHAERLTRLLPDEWDGPLDAQYLVASPRVVNVADFGVPQERYRVFFVGFRRDLGVNWHFPSPTHSEKALLYAQYVDGTYWDEHGLARRPAPSHLAARIVTLAASPKPAEARWRTVRDALAGLPEPHERKPHPDFDNHVGIPAARSYPGHTGSTWDWPAKAIKAGDHGNPGGENMLRRDDGSVRYFTVRELARLQTFPDAWHFAVSWTESRRQLGNAVPVLAAELLGRHVHGHLAENNADAPRSRSGLLVAAD